jgi:serine/threonine protein kinase
LETRINETKASNEKFTEKKIFNWTLQATEALKYLHYSKNIAHRDIKPGYVFIKCPILSFSTDDIIFIEILKKHISDKRGQHKIGRFGFGKIDSTFEYDKFIRRDNNLHESRDFVRRTFIHN